MTRGRPPRKACRKACDNAARYGEVLEISGIMGSHIDFILFVRQRVVFVRVKRSHSRISSSTELTSLFSSGIAGLRTIPLTAVVSRELWVLLPWGTWQYFCIGEDSITEVHGDRIKVSGAAGNSGLANGPVLSGTQGVSSPGPGFLCPYGAREYDPLF